MKFNKWDAALLCDIYGGLLSEKQRTALEMYCNEDYSLSEIAENTGISRQGVRDQIKHAHELLSEYENVLGLLEKRRKAAELFEEERQDPQKTLDALKELLGLSAE